MPDLTGAVWRKSTRSNAGGNCVEVADNLPGVVGIRDSKDPTGAALAFTPGSWATFVYGVKAESLNPGATGEYAHA
ncbi:DUF397 domain-containing protein [Micromonospora wenchangensis]|uniref:DUF397 domain-containing protein n=1 Tax=Micromonospora wenchangensis TaxID=1185415 RepID=A0A246REG8_9ACTN|nr:DUF397 domain-containing protein [Micromonospora wenchangensis]OWU99811.1 DUF397 domain-containing protein [Micromonospora wenchangensis]